MKLNGLLCCVCSKELIGQQSKCCSVKCKNELNSINKKGVKFSDEHRKNLSLALKNAQSTELTEKRKVTCQKRYGGNSPASSLKIQNKMKKTMKERYGVEHASQSDEVKEKIKSTCIERYGVESSFSSKEIQNKIKVTMIEKYGVEHPLQSSEFQEKKKNTNLERYGVEHASQSFEVRKKMKETCLEKYGVENPKQPHLQPIIHLLKDQEWWNGFNSINDIKCFLEPYLSLNSIYIWTNKYRPDLIGINYLISSPHQKVINLLKDNQIDFEINIRKIISPLELDIFIPSKNLAIEINGLYWHSELNGKDSSYHLNKTLKCEEKGIQLLQFWDSEIDLKWSIVSSMILSRLGIFQKKIGARECIIEEVSKEEVKTFLEENHIQGSTQFSISYGLYYEHEIVSLMIFVKSRFRKDVEWELARFVSKRNYNIPGSFSRLLKSFNHSCISYSDRRYSQGKVYEKNGFKLLSINNPSYHYIDDNCNLVNRMKYQKYKLNSLLETFYPEKTEWENMVLNGFDRVWDCGTISWHKNNS